MKWPSEFLTNGTKILQGLASKKITPKPDQVLRFLEIDPDQVKVVIIGQDPYPTKNVANGRAFAVNLDCPIPRSLINIFKEIVEVKGHFKTDRTLEHWAKQGVLLLNAALTTEIGKSSSHQDLWHDYVMSIITYLDDNFPTIKWVLWGGFAQKIGINIKGEKIIDAHPSPLSNHRRKKHTFKILNKIDW